MFHLHFFIKVTFPFQERLVSPTPQKKIADVLSKMPQAYTTLSFSDHFGSLRAPTCSGDSKDSTVPRCPLSSSLVRPLRRPRHVSTKCNVCFKEKLKNCLMLIIILVYICICNISYLINMCIYIYISLILHIYNASWANDTWYQMYNGSNSISNILYMSHVLRIKHIIDHIYHNNICTIYIHNI